MGLEDGSGGDLGTFQVLEIDGTGRVLLAGAGTVTGAASYQGEYRFDEIRQIRGASLSSSDPLSSTDVVIGAGDAVLPRRLEAVNLTLEAGAVARAGAEGIFEALISGTMTVAAGAVLDVTGQGYAGSSATGVAGGAPAGITGSLDDAGGSHGGAGRTGDAAGPAGEVFDSVYVPSLAGGGGAYDNGTGRAGGGIVTLEVRDLFLEGEIHSRGADTNFPERRERVARCW